MIGKMMVVLRKLTELLWVFDRERARLKRCVAEAQPMGGRLWHYTEGKWYYHVDFGHGVEVRKDLKGHPYRGARNWDEFLEPNLVPLEDLRILDIGCNAGLFDLRMIDAGAREVVGIDLDTRPAELVREVLGERAGKDYQKITFISGNVHEMDLRALGQFDLACMFSVAYYFGDGIYRVMEALRDMCCAVAMQGNLAWLTRSDPKYSENPFKHLAGTDGIVALLERYGFTNLTVVAPPGHPKPLVIGRK
jgi:SAM-dependent methyltransferase